MARILVVDDDRNCAAFLRLFLSDEGHEVQSAVSGREAAEAANSLKPELLITDWLLKDGTDGLDLVNRLRQDHEFMKVIFITGMPERDLRAKVAGLDVSHVFEKPLDMDRLIPVVNSTAGAPAKQPG